MKKISLKLNEVLKEIFPETLEKDLTDNQRICPTCKGLGFIIINYPFGIKDNEKSNSCTWYDNKSLCSCPSCYFGVQNLCEYCGKPLSKGLTICDCELFKQKQKQKEAEKLIEILQNTKRVDINEYDEKLMLYDYYADKYMMIDDVYDYLEEILEYNDNDFELLPKWMFGTECVKMQIEAYDIIGNACDSLHDEATENISKQDIDELQEYLNKWCEKQTDTNTFYYDTKTVVDLTKIIEELKIDKEKNRFINEILEDSKQLINFEDKYGKNLTLEDKHKIIDEAYDGFQKYINKYIVKTK